MSFELVGNNHALLHLHRGQASYIYKAVFSLLYFLCIFFAAILVAANSGSLQCMLIRSHSV